MASCSIRELSRRAGISDTAINAARADGRLSAELFGVKESGRPYVLDVDAALDELQRVISMVNMKAPPAILTAKPKPVEPVKATKPVAPKQKKIHAEPSTPPADAGDTDIAGIDETSREGLLLIKAKREKSRAMREEFQAEISKLDYLEQAKATIDREQIRGVLFAAGRQLRDQLEQIPPRLSGQLAGETDQHVISMLLTTEIKQALEELSDAFERAGSVC